MSHNSLYLVWTYKLHGLYFFFTETQQIIFFLPQQLETSEPFYDNSIKTLNQQVQFTPFSIRR